ncbi:sigma-54-dependent transcriptional regulator [Thaumasiovibrio subtropicus]|uniref:sigma-54-dependent transcriptional regulator n=1 Tax=Thaumasiovibrio subtropicus TaxID=1891207 RepID=UPI000B35A133|nr:sigma-54 dependent transcriptional regulator [Thaumasiovibrio subtropicus]
MEAEAKKRVLMVEDTASVAALYKSYLNPLGMHVDIVGTGGEAKTYVSENPPDLILLDLRLPDIQGMEVLEFVKSLHADLPVIIMTAHGSIDVAVEAMRLGARDFLIKPCEADGLRITVSNVFKRKVAPPEGGEVIATDETGTDGTHYQGFIGKSLKMQGVYRIIESAAASKATVFITGESGTGKEVCADAIHSASPRKGGPFVAINCAAIPKELIESELFGHLKGAFTGAAAERKGAVELAHNGTLFLDELCEMDLDLQSKLLRFIQTGVFHKLGSSKEMKVDVRFVCATNRDPWEEVKAGRFREDLYYRLHVIPLKLPPLCERGDDVIEIARSLLAHMAVEEKKPFVRFDDEVVDIFRKYNWPGNVRQLQNVIRNIVVLNSAEAVAKEMLPPPLNEISGVNLALEEVGEPTLSTQDVVQSQPSSLEKSDVTQSRPILPLWQVEKQAIEAAIEACDGNIPRAAGLLEVSPSTIYRKLQTWQETTGVKGETV